MGEEHKTESEKLTLRAQRHKERDERFSGPKHEILANIPYIILGAVAWIGALLILIGLIPFIILMLNNVNPGFFYAGLIIYLLACAGGVVLTIFAQTGYVKKLEPAKGSGDHVMPGIIAFVFKPFILAPFFAAGMISAMMSSGKKRPKQ